MSQYNLLNTLFEAYWRHYCFFTVYTFLQLDFLCPKYFTTNMHLIYTNSNMIHFQTFWTGGVCSLHFPDGTTANITNPFEFSQDECFVYDSTSQEHRRADCFGNFSVICGKGDLN